MTETTAQAKRRRQTDKTSMEMLDVIHLVEHAEGEWLASPPDPDAERGKTTAYLARTGAYLRFVRSLYVDTVVDARQARLMAQAGRGIATLASERLTVLHPTPDNPTPHASLGG